MNTTSPDPPRSSPKPPAVAEDARVVGRGALYLTCTKMWFLVSGYIIVFGLPRILDKGLFGKYGVVTGLGAIANALVIQGTTQAVSRFVSRNPSQAEAVRRAAYQLQALLGGGFFLVIFLAAPFIADHFWNDPDLATPLRWSGGITFFYSFYAISMGYMNGLKRFGRQALADFCFSNLKVLCILLGAVFLGGTLGRVSAAVAGFAAAAAITMVLAFFLAGRQPREGHLRVGELFRFQILTMLFTFVTTFIARADLQILKAFTPGTTAEVDELTGDYYGAQQFGAIPYQLVFAITFVLFPLVSGVAGRDQTALRSYIRNTTRYAGIIAAIVVGLFFACPERTITVLFPPDYVSAAPSLRILTLGYLFFALFFIMAAIITASGRPQVSVACGAAVALVQVGLGVLLVRDYGRLGVAAGTAAGMLLGFLLTHAYLRASFGAGISGWTFARTLLAASLPATVAHLLLAHDTLLGGPGLLAGFGGQGVLAKLTTVFAFALLGLGYLVLLSRLGVLAPEDRERFWRVFRRRGGG